MSGLDGGRRIYPTVRQSWAIAGIVILMAVACSPMLALGFWVDGEAAVLAYYLSAFGLSFYIVHSLRKRNNDSSNYDFRIASWRLVPPLMLGSIALLFGVISPMASLIPMPDAIKTAVMRNAIGHTGAFTFLYFVIAAPILEELIFRGIMLDGLLRRFGPLRSILVSSFLFGLVHLNPWQFVTGFIIGCFSGWAYFRSGSVGPCIIIHMTANLAGFATRLAIDRVPAGAERDALLARLGGGSIQLVAFYAVLLAVSVLSVSWLHRGFSRLQHVADGPEVGPNPAAI